MMDRILLYKQSAQTSEDSLRLLYGYLVNPGGSSGAELEQVRAQLQQIRAVFSEKSISSLPSSTLTSYVHMLDTLLEQGQAALTAIEAQSPGLPILRGFTAKNWPGRKY
ncbi:hypothetical protein ACVLD2_004737 [Paenibacillus sp. PvR052]|nr:hypothetical protein [Paenibacillus sp. PvP091]MBP1170499.1 hypothetical protein [Paenibacillus sp. PvR098]MBP2441527.1 hypothetical protein [Paenibacillus sp. PvP052]